MDNSYSRSNLELLTKRKGKKGPKKIEKIPGDGLEPGFEPTRGGKNDQKKENDIVGNETVGLVHRYWEC